MKKNEGITMLALTISIIILIILASVTMYYGSTIITESKRQDMKTNMLLIQASLKSSVEKYNFEIQSINDAETIESIKAKYLKGTKIDNCEQNVKNAYNNVMSELNSAKGSIWSYGYEFYYLDTATLKNMGLVDVQSDEKNGYFIVGYSIDLDTSDGEYPSDVQVINTKGYDNLYSLDQFSDEV